MDDSRYISRNPKHGNAGINRYIQSYPVHEF